MITKDTIAIEYAAAVISFVGVILTIFFLPESPKWLVGQGKMEKAAEAY